jgi:H+/Cl- antiporter ClcA
MATSSDGYIIAIIIVIFIIIALAIITYYLNLARGGTILTSGQLSTVFGLAVVTLIVLIIVFIVMIFYAYRARGNYGSTTTYASQPAPYYPHGPPTVSTYPVNAGYSAGPAVYPTYMQ